MLYNNPAPEFSALVLDLFFVKGVETIDVLLLKMLGICSREIMEIDSAFEMQNFIKKELFGVCAQRLAEDRKQASSLADFQLSFYSASKV